MTGNPYRPSNGSEGDWFESQWCSTCIHNHPEHGCKVWFYALMFPIDDKLYPKELVEGKDGPICTKWSDHAKPKHKPRCKKTGDLFG